MPRLRRSTIYYLPIYIAVLSLGLATTNSAAPPGSCEPWPQCKDEGAGDPPGLSTCNAVFSTTECWALDDPGTNCVVSRAQDNTPGWFFTQDCQTATTLIVPYSDPLLGGQGYTLKLVGEEGSGDWLGGRAAIVNEGAIARVANLTIMVNDENVADGTCIGANVVETAVSLDPHIAGTDSGVPRMNSANLTVTTRNPDGSLSDAQFCNGLEYASTSDDMPIEVPMFAGGITDNTIDEESYSNIGVVARFINTTDNVTGDSDHVSISGNTIDYSSSGCAGIRIATVERAAIGENTVYAPGCGGTGGVGIDIEDTGTGTAHPDFFTAEPIEFKKNIVITTLSTGSDVGISIVGSAVEKNEGNTLSGDGTDTAYFTCDSGDVPFPTNGKKKNTFNGTTVESAEECPP
jgi:hypothetical protein